mgnify:CR=1 FL=1
MLRRSGYPPHVAGGLLSAAGIGATLSPPTLGAAAFIIAEYLKVDYLQVLIYAAIPTLLYYLSCWLMTEGDARRFGYRRAFHHPQLIVAQCLTRLAPAEDWPRKLELWLRGPIPYGAALHLCAERGATGVVFSLHVDADRRPAIIGRLRCGHEEPPH